MAKIKGITGMTAAEITIEVNRGAKFVRYRYCFSGGIATIVRSTGVYFIRPNEGRVVKGLSWTLLTLAVGWWGIPWGPIRTVQTVLDNFRGGEDVTGNVAGVLKLTGVQWDALYKP